MLALNELSKEARELLPELVINRKEREDIINYIADEMTFDRVAEFVLEMKEENPLENGVTEIDIILWTVKQAYLSGFAKGIDIYSTAIEAGIREPKGGVSE